MRLAALNMDGATVIGANGYYRQVGVEATGHSLIQLICITQVLGMIISKMIFEGQ